MKTYLNQSPITPQSPINRIAILRGLDKRYSSKNWEKICCQGDVDPWYRKVSTRPVYLLEDQIKSKPLQEFFQYCSECHLHQDLPPPFLAASSEKEILDNLKGKKDLIRFRLRSKQMPPHFAQKPLPAKVRSRLLKHIDLSLMQEFKTQKNLRLQSQVFE